MANLSAFHKRLILKLILLAGTIYFVLPMFRKMKEQQPVPPVPSPSPATVAASPRP